MSWLAWFLIASFAPVPLVWVWFRVRVWRQRRREAELVRDLMAERRARYAGAIKVPGQRDVTPLERP